MEKIYVNHTWFVLSTNQERCSDCEHSQDMEEISLENAKKLALLQDFNCNWTYFLGEGMSQFNLR